MTNQEHIIDAEGKSLGRVATEAAILLRGKNDATFERHIAGTAKVKVINASKIKLLNNKLNTKYYKHYSGYPGGMKKEMMAQVVTKKGYGEVFRKAIYGMLPGNKLRPLMMKNLTILD
ncbi:MAG: 50S ribosomal protein L13 [Patescibacteria group bacterium]